MWRKGWKGLHSGWCGSTQASSQAGDQRVCLLMFSGCYWQSSARSILLFSGNWECGDPSRAHISQTPLQWGCPTVGENSAWKFSITFLKVTPQDSLFSYSGFLWVIMKIWRVPALTTQMNTKPKGRWTIRWLGFQARSDSAERSCLPGWGQLPRWKENTERAG